MTLSPLQVKYYVSIAIFAALVAFELVTRLDDRRKVRSGLAEDLRKQDHGAVKHNMVQHPKWRVWAEGLLIVAAGASMLVTMLSLMEYRKYGAFYDEIWRSPEVERHFLFDASGNQALEAEYLADPDGYDWDAHRVVVVKLGCEDCERVAETIRGLEADGYTVVFSRSELGRAYTEKYGLSYVPSAVLNGLVVQLRSGSSAIGTPEPGKTDGEIAEDILGDLMDGGAPAGGSDYSKYGTKAAVDAAMEELEEQKQQDKAREDGQ